jgi:hypothetical protein
MRKRQREEANEERQSKKQKIEEVTKIFEDKEFMLNEADPELTDLLEKYGAKVYLFSYYGGGFHVRIIRYKFN